MGIRRQYTVEFRGDAVALALRRAAGVCCILLKFI